ncbi:LIRP-like [Hetaerina americana]|uniref:LIRP-like n=1 Tax=Hetaerina americana TaxID=62018 RepID=UPI003A7F153F
MCSVVPRVAIMTVLCLHLLHICSGQLESMGEKRSSSKYCGRYLSNALQVVCNGVYNNPIHKKSSGDLIPAEFMHADPDSDSGFWLQNSDLEALTFPFRPKASATPLAPGSFRRVTRGVYDECCRKSCTFHEMATYCGRR